MSDYDIAALGWEAEATKKGLPAEFIENMRSTDGFTEAQKKVFVDHVHDRADFERKRARAVEIGRAHGSDEADRRRETGQDRESRIARATAYAAWEFDGKPLSSAAQRSEFGVTASEVVGSLERSLTSRLLKKDKTRSGAAGAGTPLADSRAQGSSSRVTAPEQSGTASPAAQPADSRARDVESSRAVPELPGVTSAEAAKNLKALADNAPSYADVERRFKPDFKTEPKKKGRR